jgi:hypothetical protein
MPEVDPDDPRLTNALAQLHRYLAKYHGIPMSRSILEEIQQAVDWVKGEFKTLYGLDWPPLAPLILPTSHVIVFYRRDLTDDEIKSKLLYLLRDLARAKQPVYVAEFALAVNFVWPHYQAPIEDMEKITAAKMIH